MARAIWTGVLTFGLVTVPVGLFTATEDHTVHFHQLQRGTADRVRNKRINERTGEDVDTKDIVKGYEVEPGEYVVVEPEELDEVAPGRSRTVDITDFVELAEIEPVYFARTYYVAPRGCPRAGARALRRRRRDSAPPSPPGQNLGTCAWLSTISAASSAVATDGGEPASGRRAVSFMHATETTPTRAAATA